MSRFYIIQNKDGLSLLEYLQRHPEFNEVFQNIIPKFINPLASKGTRRLKNNPLYTSFINTFEEDSYVYSRGFRELSTLKKFYSNEDLSLMSEHYFNLCVCDTDIFQTVNFTTECFAQKKLLNFLWVQNLQSIVY